VIDSVNVESELRAHFQTGVDILQLALTQTEQTPNVLGGWGAQWNYQAAVFAILAWASVVAVNQVEIALLSASDDELAALGLQRLARH
jgi:hypothetical protein